jgi:flagellar motility protein MotE (MotC chaperone)
MAEQGKKQINGDPDSQAESPENQTEDVTKSRMPSPIVLAVSGLAAFVVFLGVFSLLMGVFDKPQPTEPAADQPVEQAQEAAGGHEAVADDPVTEDTAPAQIEFNFGNSEVDTLAELSWIESEKRKIQSEQLELALERQQLEALKREVEGLLAQKKRVAGERIAYLAKLFNEMKQDEISKLMAQLDNETIVAVLPQMKTSSASRVLAMLPPERAARITTMLLGLGKS